MKNSKIRKFHIFVRMTIWSGNKVTPKGVCVDSWIMDCDGNVKEDYSEQYSDKVIGQRSLDRHHSGVYSSGLDSLRTSRSTPGQIACRTSPSRLEVAKLVELVKASEVAFEQVLRRNAELEAEVHALRTSAQSSKSAPVSSRSTRPVVPSLPLDSLRRPERSMSEFDISTPRKGAIKRRSIPIR